LSSVINGIDLEIGKNELEKQNTHENNSIMFQPGDIFTAQLTKLFLTDDLLCSKKFKISRHY